MSDSLNAAQRAAVDCLRGPCLVLAGAGSGKTRVIAHKIASLAGRGVAPQGIAAITFTNKAAAEMRLRARQLIGRRSGAVLVCTFHALGVRLLRQDGALLGLKPAFSILDSDDALALIRDCGAAVDRATARRWQWAISRFKSAGLDAARALAAAGSEDEAQAARVMQRYEERLAAYQAVDFDDLIALPLRLLREHEPVRAHWQQALAYVLVDEYQDTNASQYELLKLLVGDRADFTAVGDDDQSIYGWRGATLDNLRRLPQDFPQLRVIKLEQNYRSTDAILAAANHVIAHNPKLYAKKLYSQLGAGEPVRVLACDHEQHEAERVVARMQSLRETSQHNRWRDFAVLYRANHQARIFEQALRQAQIPYRVSGGQSFFDRAEIRDLCAWLRLLVNEDDDPAFVRAITTPKRGVGHQTLARLGDFASRARVSLFGALFEHSMPAALGARNAERLLDFGRLINDLHYRAEGARGEEAVAALLTDWLKEIAYESHLHDSSDNARQAATRWGHVLDFCNWMAARAGGQVATATQAVVDSPASNLLAVAQTVSLISTLQERETDADLVTLSTLHAAKGLEWPHVVLAGACDGILPFARDDDALADNPERIAEERRLMYVGITRAQRTLAVSWTRKRKKGRDMVLAEPSRFIEEMALDQATVREDPRQKLAALRAEFARRAAAGAADAAERAA